MVMVGTCHGRSWEVELHSFRLPRASQDSLIDEHQASERTFLEGSGWE